MVYEKKYGNGLRLVVKQMEGLLSVTMGILVGTGSSWETDSEDGISILSSICSSRAQKTHLL